MRLPCWKKLPIPDVPKNRQQQVVRLVDKILDAKARDAQADLESLEDRIDCIVRDHYGFSNDP